MNIALIGFMGSGKTTIGKKLARQLGWTFLDSDGLIQQKENCSIPEIFAQKGEVYFRECEKSVLTVVAELKKVVLATGGGLPIGEDNWKILRQSFFTVYLKAHFDELFLRITGDPIRPLLQKYPTKNQLKELYLSRVDWYEKAHVIIDTSQKKLERIIGEIIERARPFYTNQN